MLTAGEKALMRILANLKCPPISYIEILKARLGIKDKSLEKPEHGSVSEMSLKEIRKFLKEVIEREQRLRIEEEKRAEQIEDDLTISGRLEAGFTMLSDDFPPDEDEEEDSLSSQVKACKLHRERQRIFDDLDTWQRQD